MTEQQKTDNTIALAKSRDLTMKNIRYQTAERGKFWILYAPPAFSQEQGGFVRTFDHIVLQVWDSLVHGDTFGMLEGQRVTAAQLLEGGTWVTDLRQVRNPAITDRFDGTFRKRLVPVVEDIVATTETSLDDVMDVPDVDDDLIDDRPEVPAIMAPTTPEAEDIIRDVLATVEDDDRKRAGLPAKKRAARKARAKPDVPN